MNVKAQGLINGATWIRQTHGERGLEDVLGACSPAIRERLVSAIAINWHPVAELCEFYEKADELLGRSDGKVIEEMGMAGARANLKSVVLRLATYVMKPEFLARRVGGMWRQFNDEGEMEVVSLEAEHLVIRLRGLSSFPPSLLQSCTGWARVLVTTIGAANGTVRVREHVARGPDARAAWDLRWSPER